MTEPNITEPRSPGAARQIIIGLLTGGAGAACGFMAVKVFGRHTDFGWSGLLAIAIALGLFVLGVFQLVSSRTSKRVLSYNGRILPAVQNQFVMQGLVLVLGGALLVLPVVAPVVARGIDPRLFYGAAVLLFGLQTWLNVRIWQTADEFYRRALMETSAVSFWVLQGALFLWAAAERLGIAPPISAWDCVTILMNVYLVLSGIIARRLGAE